MEFNAVVLPWCTAAALPYSTLSTKASEKTNTASTQATGSSTKENVPMGTCALCPL